MKEDEQVTFLHFLFLLLLTGFCGSPDLWREAVEDADGGRTNQRTKVLPLQGHSLHASRSPLLRGVNE